MALQLRSSGGAAVAGVLCAALFGRVDGIASRRATSGARAAASAESPSDRSSLSGLSLEQLGPWSGWTRRTAVPFDPLHPPTAPTEEIIVVGTIFGLLIVGLVVGFIARAVVPCRHQTGIGATLRLGVIGSLTGGLPDFLLFDCDASGASVEPRSWIDSIIGAIIVLLIWGAVRSRRSTRAWCSPPGLLGRAGWWRDRAPSVSVDADNRRADQGIDLPT